MYRPAERLKDTTSILAVHRAGKEHKRLSSIRALNFTENSTPLHKICRIFFPKCSIIILESYFIRITAVAGAMAATTTKEVLSVWQIAN